jgi:hypothetical protein
MSNYFFDEYQKKIFQYQYKFYLLGTEEPSMYIRTLEQFLVYRYWAETEEFDSAIVESIGDFPNQRQKTFSVTLNLLQPEQYITKELEKLKKQIINEAIIVQKHEAKMRSDSEGSEFMNTPPAIWKFLKKQDINPEKAQQTFDNWDRILTVYKLHKEGIKPKGILQQANKFFTHLSTESNNSSQYRRIREDIKEAEKLIESTIKGTFPITD